jgi:hypothetical protein
MSNTVLNCGSEWRKWDLHFHTPASYDYQDNSVTDEELISSLVEQGVAVVAITDHHVIDVEKILNLQDLGKANGITVLPGIELRSELGGSEIIHFIGIFGENCDLQDVWTKLQSRLGITASDVAKVGNDRIYCDLKDSTNFIHELGGITTVHAGKKTNTIENIKNNHAFKLQIKEDLLSKHIDILEIGNPSVDTAGYKEVVFPSLGFKMPLIICSDNHNVRKYAVKENCWIKAKPSFEGLKQIIYEPDERVFIGTLEPDEKDSKLVIESIQFKGAGNLITSERIALNKNLNVIVGGFSSGKSILLNHIAKTLEVGDEFSDKKFPKYQFRSREYPNFDFEVRSTSGVSQLLSDRQQESSIIPNIKYIPQNYLSKLAEPAVSRTGKDLLWLVRGLLLEEETCKTKYDEFIVNVKKLDVKREKLIDDYFSLETDITDLEIKLKGLGNEQVIVKSIEDNTRKLSDLKKEVGLDEAERKKFDSLQSEQETTNNLLISYKQDLGLVSDFNEEVEDLLKQISDKKARLETNLNSDSIRKDVSVRFSWVDNSSKALVLYNEQLATDENGNLINAGEFKTFVETKGNRLEEIKKESSPYLKTKLIQDQAKKIQEVIREDQKSQKSMGAFKTKIIEEKVRATSFKKQIFDNLKLSYLEYPKIIKVLSTRASALDQEHLKIIGSVKFNHSKFLKNIDHSFHGGKIKEFERKYPNLLTAQLEDDEREIDLMPFDENLHLVELMEFFDDVAAGKVKLIGGTDEKRACKVLLGDPKGGDYFVEHWEVEYRNDKMGKMSTGKASFVILMLIVGLSNSKAPILIDQPEDNLDNRSISTELVDFLKLKKKERQIILVTHNPNVVINADAENVIVSNQKGQGVVKSDGLYTFNYVNGAIEDNKKFDKKEKELLDSMGIREHIAQVVEGGEDAFKKREEKYGFSKD